MVHPLTDAQIADWKLKIDGMSQVECARLHRFGESGIPVFITEELHKYFNAHFKSLGGMTPGISKLIGW